MKKQKGHFFTLSILLVISLTSCRLHKLELPDYPVAGFGDIKTLKVCQTDSTIRYPQIVKGENNFGIVWLEKNSEKKKVYFAPVVIDRAKAIVNFSDSFCISENASYPALCYNNNEFDIAYCNITLDSNNHIGSPQIHIERRSNTGDFINNKALDIPVYSHTPRISFCQNSPPNELALCWIDTKAPNPINFVLYDTNNNIITEYKTESSEEIQSDNITGIYFQSHYYLFWSKYDPAFKDLSIYSAIYNRAEKTITTPIEPMKIETNSDLINKVCLSVTQLRDNLILAAGLLFNDSSRIEVFSFKDLEELTIHSSIKKISDKSNVLRSPVIRAHENNLILAWSLKDSENNMQGITYWNNGIINPNETNQYFIEQNNYQPDYPSLCWDKNHPVLLWSSEENSKNLWIAF